MNILICTNELSHLDPLPLPLLPPQAFDQLAGQPTVYTCLSRKACGRGFGFWCGFIFF